MIHETALIHPKAHVEGASVGAGSKVWQFATVIRGTVLGADCSVGAGAVLEGPVIGDRCKIGPGVHIGPGFLIEDDVFIGSNVVLCNDMWPAASQDGWDVEALRSGLITVRVEDGAAIGVNAVVLPGVVVGAKSLVAAGAVVTRDVPAGMLWGRDGSVAPIKPEWRKHRMRACGGRA